MSDKASSLALVSDVGESEHLVAPHAPPPEHAAVSLTWLAISFLFACLIFAAERRNGAVTRAWSNARVLLDFSIRFIRQSLRGGEQTAAEAEKAGLTSAGPSGSGAGSGDLEQGGAAAGKIDGSRRASTVIDGVRRPSTIDGGLPAARTLPALTWPAPSEYSPLLSARDLRALMPQLPSRVIGKDLSLVFSSQRACLSNGLLG